jgi:hypothetical protein
MQSPRWLLGAFLDFLTMMKCPKSPWFKEFWTFQIGSYLRNTILEMRRPIHLTPPSPNGVFSRRIFMERDVGARNDGLCLGYFEWIMIAAYCQPRELAVFRISNEDIHTELYATLSHLRKVCQEFTKRAE